MGWDCRQGFFVRPTRENGNRFMEKDDAHHLKTTKIFRDVKYLGGSMGNQTLFRKKFSEQFRNVETMEGR